MLCISQTYLEPISSSNTNILLFTAEEQYEVLRRSAMRRQLSPAQQRILAQRHLAAVAQMQQRRDQVRNWWILRLYGWRHIYSTIGGKNMNSYTELVDNCIIHSSIFIWHLQPQPVATKVFDRSQQITVLWCQHQKSIIEVGLHWSNTQIPLKQMMQVSPEWYSLMAHMYLVLALWRLLFTHYRKLGGEAKFFCDSMLVINITPRVNCKGGNRYSNLCNFIL